MRIPRIYTQHRLQASTSIGLEAKAVSIFNGDGNDYYSIISELSKKNVSVDIESQQSIHNESLLSIHLLQPLCRADKMDWCLQKATELGVNAITPFISSQVNINVAANRLDKKMDHWRSVIESACEQSGRAMIPSIKQPIVCNVAINNSPSKAIKLIASPMANENTFSYTDTSTSNCICAIGPEGGFDQNEILQAQNEGFAPIKIGPRILRLETAVISALTLCQSRWGDFN